MDISLNKTQKDMAKEARRFLKKECPIDYVQDVISYKQDMSQTLWNAMVGSFPLHRSVVLSGAFGTLVF